MAFQQIAQHRAIMQPITQAQDHGLAHFARDSDGKTRLLYRFANGRNARRRLVQWQAGVGPRGEHAVRFVDRSARKDERAGREGHGGGALHHQQFCGLAGAIAHDHDRSRRPGQNIMVCHGYALGP